MSDGMRRATTKPLHKLRAAGISDVKFRACGGVIEHGHGCITSDSPCYDEFMHQLGHVPSAIAQRSEKMELAHKAALERKRELIETAGPLLWAELHRWALTVDVSAPGKWLAEFAMRLPCGTCRQHWREMLKATPPDLSSNAALFAWTVDRHNEVNARLNKPAMTVEDARAMWH